ncbi:PRELI/MSF1 domain [Cinara cedri]|uniref:PRELI/MSF1 domain n=1 Tax=Cinara cedri TaxID=506608 RepID=A0A5E4M8H3_9HEMI|nr:PRELI/MSF1 domain [Cinara cedri]
MKIWTAQHIFNHSWETVVQASFFKYPNPMNTAVKSIDVIDRQVINGELHSYRLINTRWTLPNWASALIGPMSTFYAVEYSKVSRDQRKLRLDSHNLSLRKFVEIREKLTYEAYPEDPQKTLLKQTTYVTVKGLPFNGCIENILTSKISENAAKGRQAIEWVIENL